MKNRMVILAALLLLSPLLSSCATPAQQSDATKAIVLGCTFIDVGGAAFDTYVAGHPGKIDAKGLIWKRGVMATFAPICANPAAVSDPNQTLTEVMKAGFALSDFIVGVSKAPVP